MSTKPSVKKKDPRKAADAVQDLLEHYLAEQIEAFFNRPDIRSYKLDEYDEEDVQNSAMLTLFTKSVAYLSAQDESVDHQRYLQEIFEAMSLLFARSRASFVKFLKEQGEKNTTAH